MKLVAHASHLLTGFIQLRERYALLHPMLFDLDVPQQYGCGKQARGFDILKNSLFLSCCQDIAKLSTDKYDQTPSIKKLMASLLDDAIRAECRNQYCLDHCQFADDDNDPELVEVLQQMALEDVRKQGETFDKQYCEAVALWKVLSTSAILNSFRTVRDQVSAHTDVQFVDDEYRLVDIGELGIKWGDLKTTIARMQELVELIGQLVRCTGFAWTSLDQMLAKAGNDFWLVAPHRGSVKDD